MGRLVQRLPDDPLSTIRDTGELSEETEATLKESVEAFSQTFRSSDAAEGSEAGRGEGTPPDEVRPDVGWDRMSSVEDDQEEEGGPSTAEEDHVEGGVPLPEGDEGDAADRGPGA